MLQFDWTGTGLQDKKWDDGYVKRYYSGVVEWGKIANILNLMKK